MGYDPVRGPNTYGSGCMAGAERLFAYMRETYQAGSLGCYNPASLGGRSLHAEGRAMDIALNANDPLERARGDAIFAAVMANPDAYGAQEMLWRGYLWSYQKRDQGKRGPGIQQSDHMNHVHLGIDVNAARNWDRSWLGAVSTPRLEYDDMPQTLYVLTKGTKARRSDRVLADGTGYVFANDKMTQDHENRRKVAPGSFITTDVTDPAVCDILAARAAR